MIAFVVLQMLRLPPKKTLGEVKERLQREASLSDYPHKPRRLKGKVSTAYFPNCVTHLTQY